MPTIWRLHIKRKATTVDASAFCIDKRVLGIGWAVELDADNLDWDTYYSRAMKHHYESEKDKGWWPAINALKNSVQVNDLCWTRLENGKYWLGRISGEWQYCNLPDFKRADVVNLRTAELYEVGNLQQVPGAVLNAFRPRRTLQKINGEAVKLYSMYLFNQLSRREIFPLATSGSEIDLFTLFSPSECEDIVDYPEFASKSFVCRISPKKKRKTHHTDQQSGGTPALAFFETRELLILPQLPR